MADMPAEAATKLTVVVCSFNGADGVDRVLGALSRQTIAESMHVVLVDDASTDGTAAVGRRHGVKVISHASNRGLGAARNTGLAAAQSSIVAFLDDDCEPADDWAARILQGFENEGAVGVGGAIRTCGVDSYLTGYLTRHSPLLPLELELADRADVPYRFARYLLRNWRGSAPSGTRWVFSIVGANMAFRAEALQQLGGFDDDMRFGSEDVDMCLRIRAAYGDRCLLFEPSAVVDHHFRPGLRDTLRRSWSYGRGHPRMLAKYPQMRPTVFPLPIAVLGLLAFSVRRPKAALLAAALPHVVHPAGLLSSAHGDPRILLDPYAALLQEAAYDVGILDGIRQSRSHPGGA